VLEPCGPSDPAFSSWLAGKKSGCTATGDELACDGCDSDGDGQVDEGFALGGPCDDGRRDRCKRTGTEACRLSDCGYYCDRCSETACDYYCVEATKQCLEPNLFLGAALSKPDCVRACLQREDASVRGGAPGCRLGAKPGCLAARCIIEYHDRCFADCGESTPFPAKGFCLFGDYDEPFLDCIGR
jgi:hypothetical protein